MATEFLLNAERREDAGKGASRRLRRQGKLPAVIYGGEGKAATLTLDHNELLQHLKREAFHSQILTVKIGRKKEQAVLKDIQRHPFKNEVLHLDLLRVKAGEALRMSVPLHFMGADKSPGVDEGGVFSRTVVEVEIECLPKDLPEHLEIDVSALNIGDAVHLSDIPLPEGVALAAFAHLEEDEKEEHDLPVAAIHHARVTEEEEPEEEEEELAEGEAGEAEAEAEAGEEEAGEGEDSDEAKKDESGE